MSQDKRINLVYIASIGRSGSTLLESMLGAHSKMQTMGELHIWPHEIEMGGVRECSCGRYVQDCTFWSEMERRVDPLGQPSPRLNYFREKHNAGRTLRLPRLDAFKTDYKPSPEEAEAIRLYGENNRVIFQTFLDLLEEQHDERPEWIVDASKDPYRLAWLHHSGLFNIRVVHLVKNPCAFIYSVTKHLIGEQASFNPPRRWYYTARQSVAWIIQNGLFSRFAAHHFTQGEYLLLNYETLASAPHDSFKQVCEHIGSPYEPAAVENFRMGGLHTIAGNPMRYETRPIALDEKWKTRLPRSSKALASMLTSVNKAHYGYS